MLRLKGLVRFRLTAARMVLFFPGCPREIDLGYIIGPRYCHCYGENFPKS